MKVFEYQSFVRSELLDDLENHEGKVDEAYFEYFNEKVKLSAEDSVELLQDFEVFQALDLVDEYAREHFGKFDAREFKERLGSYSKNETALADALARSIAHYEFFTFFSDSAMRTKYVHDYDSGNYLISNYLLMHIASLECVRWTRRPSQSYCSSISFDSINHEIRKTFVKALMNRLFGKPGKASSNMEFINEALHGFDIFSMVADLDTKTAARVIMESLGPFECLDILSKEGIRRLNRNLSLGFFSDLTLYDAKIVLVHLQSIMISRVWEEELPLISPTFFELTEKQISPQVENKILQEVQSYIGSSTFNEIMLSR